MSLRHPTTVDTRPTKALFASMLTRDIELCDAILDLLDNCVDGIVRSRASQTRASARPYKGFWAHISFDHREFSIEDNCGGIPRDLALHYAFRFGRDSTRQPDKGTVGVYGIGMKRAIFKMGKEASILSQRDREDGLEVRIPNDWVEREEWSFPYADKSKALPQTGTCIVVRDLYPETAHEFSNRKTFEAKLSRAISYCYSQIMAKGFGVTVNGKPVPNSEFKLLVPTMLLSKAADRRGRLVDSIMPYIFEGSFEGGVSAELMCGFCQPITGSKADGLDNSAAETQGAGWTVACNDRVVLYNDKSELTGWGAPGVPRFHAQFNMIAGFVNFRADDASRLPMNTTKRGVDSNAPVFLQVRDYMIQGTRIFTDFTNRWKADDRVAGVFKETGLATARQIERQRPLLRQVRSRPGFRQLTPVLPLPPPADTCKRITFRRPDVDIAMVAAFVGHHDASPSEIGGLCFDYVYGKASVAQPHPLGFQSGTESDSAISSMLDE